MSFEETLICDGCGTVLNGGDRLQMTRELREAGGRSFVSTLGAWTEVKRGNGDRHLCGACTRKGRRQFGDGTPIPPPAREER